MQQFLHGVATLVGDPNFWHVVVTLVLGLVFVPKGVASQFVAQQAAKVDAKLPANQYAWVKTLAEDVVTYTWSYGNHAGWTNEQKLDEAVQQLAALVGNDAGYDDQTLQGIIEQVWVHVKPRLLAQQAVTAQIAAQVPAPTTPAPAQTAAPQSGTAEVSAPAPLSGSYSFFSHTVPVVAEDGSVHAPEPATLAGAAAALGVASTTSNPAGPVQVTSTVEIAPAAQTAAAAETPAQA